MTPTLDVLSRQFWERAALSAIDAILATEKDCTVEEAAGMAADVADHLLKHWRSRFSKCEEGEEGDGLRSEVRGTG